MLRSIKKVPPPHTVKTVLRKDLVTVFSREFKENQNNRVKLFSKMTFYLSNDHVNYWDIPYKIRHTYASATRTYFQKHQDVQPIHLMVGEGNFLSWLVEDIPGDLLIMDIDQKLIDHLQNLIAFIKCQYDDYQQNKVSFEDVKAAYMDLLKTKAPCSEMILFLGPYAWLANEANYIKAMQNLLKREVYLLNINLFDNEEVLALVHLLKAYHYEVSSINLTNLPDYDRKNQLVYFLKNVPMPTEKNARLLFWNVHDRGIGNESENNHFLRYTHMDIKEYEACFNQVMPHYFALQDVATLFDYCHKNKQNFSEKFAQYLKTKMTVIHHIYSDILIDEFYEELKRLHIDYSLYYKVCIKSGRSFSLNEFHKFLNWINYTNNIKPLYYVNSEHAYIIGDISSLCEELGASFLPAVFETLKLDLEFARCVKEDLLMAKEVAPGSRPQFITQSYWDLLMVWLVHNPLNISRAKNILEGQVSEECITHITHMSQYYHHPATELIFPVLMEVIASRSTVAVESPKLYSDRLFMPRTIGFEKKLALQKEIDAPRLV